MKSLVKSMAVVVILVIGLCACGGGSNGGGSNSPLWNINKKTVVEFTYEDWSSLKVTLYADGTCHSEGVYPSGKSFSYDGKYKYKSDTYHDIHHEWISIKIAYSITYGREYWVDIMKDGSVYSNLAGSKFEKLDQCKKGKVTSIN